MNTGKIYYNLNGDPKTIHQMVKEEPEWAASKIQYGERHKALLDQANVLLQLFNDLSCDWFRYSQQASVFVEIMALREKIKEHLAIGQ